MTRMNPNGHTRSAACWGASMARTSSAPAALTQLRDHWPSLYLGAGTVLSVDQVQIAADCGADFIVSPGFNPSVVRKSIELGLPVLPGVATPREIEMALGL